LFTRPTDYCGNTNIKAHRLASCLDISLLLQFRICSSLLRSILLLLQSAALWINWRIRSVSQYILWVLSTQQNAPLTIAQVFKRSQIRPPSKIPSPGKGLCEISESQSNARSKASAIPPPQMSTKLNGLSCEYDKVSQNGCFD